MTSNLENVTNVNGAKVFLDESEIEELVIEYLEEMEEHPAYKCDTIRVMPDTHPEPNSQTLIGFTMDLDGVVPPNNVGNDIGCGVSGYNFANETISYSDDELEEIDEKVRKRVPMGRGREGYSSPDRQYYNVKEQYPWDVANTRLERFIEQQNLQGTSLDNFLSEGGYDIEYFKSLCRKVRQNMTQAINGVGTLGAGNHFIEIGRGENSGVWIIVHSGSRSLGKSVADYHQRRANNYRSAEYVKKQIPEEYAEYLKFDIENVSDKDLIEWVTGGKGESFVDFEALRNDYQGQDSEKIESIGNKLKPKLPHETEDWNSNWVYLKEEETYEYYKDMLFCQLYATENRRVMLEEVVDVLDFELDEGTFIDSPHNIVDFKDSTIRKGATSAHEGEKNLIPFNMSDGVVLVEGKGNSEWNKSVCHGAGRKGSRAEAKENISEKEARDSMEGIYASEIPLDESKQAYKDSELILERIQPTVNVLDEIRPIINFKAP